ncbi:MAG TPA: alpha/beta hydrolase [Streptosporangiaceae bacterium]|jgi:alpha-beta hydrolase superfamily lysophospholipase|nr:alpha/beta hydrolase [Streptosporangiaceae bacterium]
MTGHQERAARIIQVTLHPDPEALVLVLHGGAARREARMVSPAQLSVLRMIPVARQISRAGRGRLAVFRLLNSHRGWDSRHTPVQDVDWALGKLRGQLGRLPVGLVGHSLGGRAALLSVAQPDVASVVALAPWVYPTDFADATGRQVLIVHGSSDRVASQQRSATVARAMGERAAVGYVLIDGGRHAMLRHHRQFTSLAADFTTAALLEI